MTETFDGKSKTGVTVVIPAYNEEGNIAACLDSVLEHSGTEAIEVIVAANGCIDNTVPIARRYEGVRTLDLSVPSKVEALRTADEMATYAARIYLDGDVTLSPGTISALVQAILCDEAVIAVPEVEFDLAESSWWVRSFYRVGRLLPHLQNGTSGRGVYALSAKGRSRFDQFPDLQADDLFVGRLFSASERRVVAGTSQVIPPRNAANLLKVRRRIAVGNQRLATDADSVSQAVETPHDSFAPSTQGTAHALVEVARRRPGLWPSLAVYVATVVAARLWGALAPNSGHWQRDVSTRSSANSKATLSDQQTLRVLYLTSHYPALSQAFIEREISAVRKRGIVVETASIRPFHEGDLRSHTMREEAARTQVLIGSPVQDWLMSQARLLRHPRAWSRSVWWAAREGDSTPAARLWQGFYFAEAALLHDRLRNTQIRHIHAHHANVSASVAMTTCEIGNALDGPGTWTWSLTIHGSAEFHNVREWDVPAKVEGAAAISCISDFTRGQVMRLVAPEHWDKMEVIHMTVDDKFVPPSSPRHHDGPLRLLTIGRLVSHKGIPILVDAVSQLRERGVPVTARIIGEGELREQLEAHIVKHDLAEWIELVGPVGQDDILEHYHWADCYVLPSFLEGLPVVIMEAMSTALPVISTQISGIPELIEHGRSGLFVPTGRSDLLADAVASLSASPELRVALGEAGRAAVLESFTERTTGDQMASFLRRAAQGRP